MQLDEYIRFDAIALAELVRQREVSADELFDSALARMAETNGQVNAVVEAWPERARAEIERGLPDGPLCGVPFLLKDLGIAYVEMCTVAGARLLADSPPAKEDSPLGAAFRKAGLVVFGKTNTPEFGIDVVTEPELYGPARNPWDFSRAVGGSSGGAAAAVAAGIVPAAHGNDGGGSLRIPAAACGLFSMKPSKGRVSMAPVGEGWGGMSTQGVISRSVRDSALLLDLICQPQPGDPYWRDPPTIPYAACVDRPPACLRIGFSTISMLGDAIHPDCAAAVEEAARLCERLGHSVREVALSYSFGAVGQATSSVISANVRANLMRIGEERGAPVTEDEVEAETWTLAEIGGGVDAAGYVRSLQHLQGFTRSFAKSFEAIDVLITATIGHPAPPVGAFKGTDRSLARIRAWAPNTTIFNVTGQPAMTLPLALSADCLPIGVQMAARAGEEGLLFSLAAQIERAQPWTGLAIARSGGAE